MHIPWQLEFLWTAAMTPGCCHAEIVEPPEVANHLKGLPTQGPKQPQVTKPALLPTV